MISPVEIKIIVAAKDHVDVVTEIREALSDKYEVVIEEGLLIIK